MYTIYFIYILGNSSLVVKWLNPACGAITSLLLNVLLGRLVVGFRVRITKIWFGYYNIETKTNYKGGVLKWLIPKSTLTV